MVYEILIKEIITMFLLMGLGIFMYRKNYISDKGTYQMSNILLYFCTPCIIITSFNTTVSLQKLEDLGITFILSVISITIGFLVAYILFKKDKRIERFAIGFSNIGFIGIPLVTGILGIEYVFYLSIYIVCFNLFLWTVGVYLISGNRNMITIKKALINPGTIGVMVGLCILITQIKIPSPITNAVSMVGSMNTPLAMIILGSYIAKADIKSLFKNKIAYLACIGRLIIVPAIVLILLRFIPNDIVGIKMVILIAASTPSAVTVALFSQQFKENYEYASQLVSLSTLLSVITLPIIIMATNILWI